MTAERAEREREAYRRCWWTLFRNSKSGKRRKERRERRGKRGEREEKKRGKKEGRHTPIRLGFRELIENKWIFKQDPSLHHLECYGGRKRGFSSRKPGSVACFRNGCTDLIKPHSPRKEEYIKASNWCFFLFPMPIGK